MRLLPFALLLTGGCSSPVVEGNLTDAAGKPLAGMSVAIIADGPVGMTCQKLGATTDDAGHFRIEGPCLAETSYTVKTNDDALWLSEGGTVPKGNAAPLKVVAVRAGSREGLYIASGDELTSLRTGADLRESTLGGAPFQFVLKSKNVHLVAGTDSILLNGAEANDAYHFHPVTWTPGPLTLGDGDAALTVPEGSGIWMLDATVVAGALQPKPVVTPDPSKVRTIAKDASKLTWIPADGLAEGRYALFRDSDRRPYLIDFGKSQE